MWKPIETAPKDGRPILLWAAREASYAVARYTQNHGWILDYNKSTPIWQVCEATDWAPILPPPS